MRPALLTALAACLVLVSPGVAAASWQGAGSGGGYSKAGVVPAGTTPAASVSGRNVTVSWTASALGGGRSLDGYVVNRYSMSGVKQSIAAGCTGTIAALACVEQATPAGTWRYSVTPVIGAWRGTESSQSPAVTVNAAGLSLTPTAVSSLPAALSGQITSFLGGQTVTFRLDDPSTGQLLSGAITPTPVPADGTAAVSVTIPSGIANGAHTVYAIGSQGDVATATVTVSEPVTISTTAWDLRDASSGAEQNASEPTAYASDGLTYKTGNFNNAFASNRYLQWTYNSPLRTGLAASSVSFDFRFRANGGSDVACFYFDVISGGSTIGTHGATTPGEAKSAWCADATEKLVSTPLPEVSSSDLANGLRIKVYGYESAKKPLLVDQATVSGTVAPTQSFTLHETAQVDSSSGTAATEPWSLVAADNALYASAANWQNAITSSRYLKLGFPAYVPAAATAVSASFKHAYRSASANNACYYFDVYSGASLIGTHGSAASPVSCNNSTSSLVTDTVALPEVSTAALANSLFVKLYVSNAGSKKSEHDLAQLSITYTP